VMQNKLLSIDNLGNRNIRIRNVCVVTSRENLLYIFLFFALPLA